jgi:hypothetical protein
VQRGCDLLILEDQDQKIAAFGSSYANRTAHTWRVVGAVECNEAAIFRCWRININRSQPSAAPTQTCLLTPVAL